MGSSRLLSDLPDDIVSKIISCYLASPNLTNKQALQLGLLSKAILRDVRRRPTLMFKGSELIFKKRLRAEIDYLCKTLSRYYDESIHLESFTFDLLGHFTQNGILHRCIDLATKNKLKSLNLIRVGRDLEPLPQSVHRAGSLEQLTLKGWDLKLIKPIWGNLKQLCLDSVNLDSSFFEDVLSSCCPKMESLELLRCCLDKPGFSFSIGHLNNLKKVTVLLGRATQKVQFDPAPTLETIACSYDESLKYSVSSTIVILNRNLGELKYRNLRTLSLENCFCDIFRVGNIADGFPWLEELSVSNNMALQRISLSSPSLKKIRLANMSSLKEVHFEVPNIVLFEFECINNMAIDKMRKLSIVGNPKGWMSHITLNSYEWQLECGAEWCWSTFRADNEDLFRYEF